MFLSLRKDRYNPRGFFLGVCVLGFLLPNLLHAQSDSLSIIFDRVTIQNSFSVEGLRADFPWPVLSIITVKDSSQRYVHGLADTSRWLSDSDTSQIGVPVHDIWTQVHEVHEEDPAIPPDPDVKNTVPEYLVTEVFDVEGLGLTLVLTMDYSGSLGDDIYKSEDAAKVFIRQMTSNDRAAIVKFTGKVNVFQQFTSDTSQLLEAIDRPTDDREYTALYDALVMSVNLCLSQTGRRVVVAYTDGKDNFSAHNINDVIKLAKQNKIPIYMIGLGDAVAEETLRQISEETGGVYMYATSVEDLADLYIQIWGLIRGYYVMAHTSPDPFYNGTWRVVDLTLKHGTAEGRGEGRYDVPFLRTDLEVVKTVDTDSTAIGESDTLHYALTGDTVLFDIAVTNHGPVLAGDVRIVDVPDDSLEIVWFETPPESVTPDSVVWSLSQLEAGQTVHFQYQSVMDTLQVIGNRTLTNRVWVRCPIDSVSGNDLDSVSVVYVPLTPPDAAVSKTAVIDTLTEGGQSLSGFVQPGDTIAYEVLVVNQGQQDAVDLTMEDVLPPGTIFLDFEGGGAVLDGDTLRWIVDRIEFNLGSRFYRYWCQADTVMVPIVQSWVNRVEVFCPGDTALGNNTAQDTVLFVPYFPPDVAVSKTGIGDSLSVSGGDSLWFANPGDTVEYRVTLVNGGDLDGRDVVVEDVLPSGLTYLDFEGATPALESDTLRWTVDRVEIGGVIHSFRYWCRVDTVMVPETQIWVNRAEVFCPGDTVLWNNTAQDTVFFVPFFPPDMAISKTGIGDSLSISGSDSLWFVEPGDTVEYRVTLVNWGDLDGRDIVVEDVLPPGLTFLDFEGASPEIEADTLRWSEDRIESNGGNRSYRYWCRVDTVMVPGTQMWVNRAEVFCPGDEVLGNNTVQDTVFFDPFYPPDVAVFKQGIGDSLTVVHGDSVWFIHAGDTMEYHVRVANVGDLVAEDIQVRDVLPPELFLVAFDEPTSVLDGDTLRWTVDLLEPFGGFRNFVYTCRVDTFMPPWQVRLLNGIEVSCSQDTVLSNNTAQDTVWAAGLVPPDPQIRVSPTLVEPRDSVLVEVMTPVLVKSWDLQIRYEDGTTVDTYADGFVQSTVLEPNVWTPVSPRFGDTWMTTSDDEENIVAMFTTVDDWDVERSATAVFRVQSNDEYLLDENVFKPGEGVPLGLRFKINSNRIAQIIVYDISGAFIRKVTEEPYPAGWNRTSWDGKDETGRTVGSGVYVAVLISGDYHKAHKFIVIR